MVDLPPIKHTAPQFRSIELLGCQCRGFNTMEKNEFVKHPVPSELIEINDYAIAAKKCRDKAVKGYFKFQLRNATYFGKIAEAKSREFWRGINELYPDLGPHLNFNATEGMVWEIDKP